MEKGKIPRVSASLDIFSTLEWPLSINANSFVTALSFTELPDSTLQMEEL